MKQLLRGIILSVTMLLFATIIAAQETCDLLVEQALIALEENCVDLGRNTACYGYNNITADFIIDPPPTFDLPGDIVNVADFSSIETAEFDPETDEWGVALMQLQANIPDTLPGQNVVFVLMGNTQMTSALTDETVDQSPMQAFYFTTGIGLPRCQQAPDTLLIQSPKNQTVEMTINEVNVKISSTAVLSLVDEGDAFEITMADGQAVIDDATTVPEGHWAKIPLAPSIDDESGIVVGLPEEIFCRPVPDDKMVPFQQLVDQMPEDVMNYVVDTIERDEAGCTGHNNEN